MTSTRQTPFFGPIPARDATMGAYLSFLSQRNGEGFVNREQWLQRADGAAVRYRGEPDQGAFERGWSKFDAGEAKDPGLTGLLAFVKINAGEAFGVEAVGRARHARPVSSDPVDRVERVLLEEERYHTRILLGASHQFGLQPPSAAYRPPAAVKLLIGTLVHAPSALFHPVLLAAEVGGLFLFNWLLTRVRELYAEQPELRDTLEQRLIEIIVDEIGHVAFNRVAVGPLGLEVGRTLSPEVAHATAGTLPELQALGWTRETSTSRWSHCPNRHGAGRSSHDLGGGEADAAKSSLSPPHALVTCVPCRATAVQPQKATSVSSCSTRRPG